MHQRLAVFVSGSGTLLEAMLAQALPVRLVLADRPCRGIDQVARAHNLPTCLMRRLAYDERFDRGAFTREVLGVLRGFDIGIVAMAGFMTVLGEEVFEYYHGRILNTHPALLPNFKGTRAVRDALAAGVSESGCTIHVATAALDEGPIIAQARVPVVTGDTVETLHERIKAAERALYPGAILQHARALPAMQY